MVGNPNSRLRKAEADFGEDVATQAKQKREGVVHVMMGVVGERVCRLSVQQIVISLESPRLVYVRWLPFLFSELLLFLLRYLSPSRHLERRWLDIFRTGSLSCHMCS